MAERYVQHTFLGIVKFQHTRKQHRADLGYSCTHGMSLLSEQVPERNGERLRPEIGEPDNLIALGNKIFAIGWLSDTSKVAFDVGHENRHAVFGKTFCHRLQGDGLACARSTRDQTMTVCVFKGKRLAKRSIARFRADKNIRYVHGKALCRSIDLSTRGSRFQTIGNEIVVFGPQRFDDRDVVHFLVFGSGVELVEKRRCVIIKSSLVPDGSFETSLSCRNDPLPWNAARPASRMLPLNALDISAIGILYRLKG